MNFKYEKGISDLLINRVYFKKEEEQKNENEAEIKKDEPKEVLIQPRAKEVLSKADELLTNYVKAAINKTVTHIAEVSQAVNNVVQRAAADYIAQWTEESDTMDNEGKISLLTSIIDSLKQEGGITDLWQLRRFSIIHNKNMDDLESYRRGYISERPGRPYVDGEGCYDDLKVSDDTNMYLKYSRMFYHGGGIADDELRTSFLEAQLGRQARWLEANRIDLEENPDNQNFLNLAKVGAQLTLTFFNQLTENTNNPWKAIFGQIKSAFTAFKDGIEQFKEGLTNEVGIDNLLHIAREGLGTLVANNLPGIYQKILTFALKSLLSHIGLSRLMPD